MVGASPERIRRFAREFSRGYVRAPKKTRFVVSEAVLRTGRDVPFASFTTPGGSRLRLHAEPISLGLWRGSVTDEGPDVRMCLDRLRAGDVALDVGANIGHFTVAMARRVGPDGLVVSIEPNPATFRRLQENVRLNRLRNVTCIRAALTSVDGSTASFFVPGRLSNEGALGRKSLDCRYEKLQVECRSGANLLSELNLSDRPIAVVKIDVEGYELSVLQGFGAALQHVGAVVFEYVRENQRHAGIEGVGVLNYLREQGYIVDCDPSTEAGDFIAVRETLGHTSASTAGRA